MSTILKALRQLEDDKSQPERDLMEDVIEPTSRRPSRAGGRGQLWIGGALGLIGAGLLVMVFVPLLRNSGPEEPETIPELAAGAAAAPPARVGRAPLPTGMPPVAPPDRRVAVAAPPAGPAAAPPPSLVAAPPAREAALPRAPEAQPDLAPAESSSAGAGVVAAAPASPASPPVPRPRPAGSKGVARAEEPERVASAPPPTPAAPTGRSDAVKPSASPPAEESSQRIERDEPVLARAMPIEPRRRIVESPRVLRAPEAIVEGTVWHPRSERRAADLLDEDGTTLTVREGDEFLGYAIVEITPSAVVFGREGLTVQRRIGER